MMTNIYKYTYLYSLQGLGKPDGGGSSASSSSSADGGGGSDPTAGISLSVGGGVQLYAGIELARQNKVERIQIETSNGWRWLTDEEKEKLYEIVDKYNSAELTAEDIAKIEEEVRLIAEHEAKKEYKFLYRRSPYIYVGIAAFAFVLIMMMLKTKKNIDRQ